MGKSLPSISIEIDKNPKEFLLELKEVSDFDEFDVIFEEEINYYSLDIAFNLNSIDSIIQIQLIATNIYSKSIIVEIRSDSWISKKPTYGLYCEIANTVLMKLLDLYSEKFEKRYSINIK